MRIDSAKVRIFCGIWVVFGEKYVIVAIGIIAAIGGDSCYRSNSCYRGMVAIGGIEVIKMIFVVRDFRYSSFICNFAK